MLNVKSDRTQILQLLSLLLTSFSSDAQQPGLSVGRRSLLRWIHHPRRPSLSFQQLSLMILLQGFLFRRQLLLEQLEPLIVAYPGSSVRFVASKQVVDDNLRIF